ncbi:hypothetical protein MKZ38_008053 [Zalerion maritima]|uniref:Uncharacterized protein n=1 Tax=Zalerion maritima TaxID=339359 RepID=A0AAD5WMN9_9PEZI|nr:hypothetical protein MKZ38_008053 [Zalerion maritima]
MTYRQAPYDNSGQSETNRQAVDLSSTDVYLGSNSSSHGAGGNQQRRHPSSQVTEMQVDNYIRHQQQAGPWNPSNRYSGAAASTGSGHAPGPASNGNHAAFVNSGPLARPVDQAGYGQGHDVYETHQIPGQPQYLLFAHPHAAPQATPAAAEPPHSRTRARFSTLDPAYEQHHLVSYAGGSQVPPLGYQQPAWATGRGTVTPLQLHQHQYGNFHVGYPHQIQEEDLEHGSDGDEDHRRLVPPRRAQ